MDRQRRLAQFGFLAGAWILFAGCPLFAGGQPPSSTQPSPDVTAILNKLDASYAGLHSAEFDGHVIGQFDIAGQQKSDDISFTSSFRAPNQFKHDAKGDVLLGSTGQTAYAFEPGRNVYISADAPKERGDLSDWPRAISGILQQQNPSLLMALTKGGGGLKELGQEMTRLSDSKIGGRAYPTIQFDLPPEHQLVTLLIDSQTGLLRQAKFDLRKSMEARGATDVKTAEVTVDYTNVNSGIAMDDSSFARSPPAGATLATTTGPANPAGDSDIAAALVGKPAPDFSLPGLDDKPVKLSSLKGSIVMLDFWATWCPPCIASMPDVEQLYKDQSGRGLKVLAIDQMEEKDVVKAFVEQKKISLPILLDVPGEVSRQYGAADLIPESVIISKDGIVKQVFTGIGHEEEIKAAVVKALGE